MMEAEKNIATPFSELQMIRRRCLRAHHANSSCSACMDVCDRKALYLSDGRVCIDRNRCTQCGKCTSVCKTEALSFGKNSESALDAVLFAGKKALRLTCSQCTEEKSDFRLHCFHQLKKSFIAEAAAAGVADLTCISGPCRGCACNGANDEPRDRVAADISSFGVQNKVRFTWETKAAEVQLAKRQLLKNVLAEVKNDTAADSGDSTEPWKRVPDGRKRLLWGVKKIFADCAASLDSKKHFFIPGIDSAKCNGCAACASSCPTGALKIEKRGDNLAYVCASYACVGCGLCRDVCFPKAVTLSRVEDPTQLLNGQSAVLHVCGELKIDEEDCWENKIGKMFNAPIYRT
jgi:NAD-dependent dihydropyrimidine dehydrogenase PreA subunit